MADQDQNNFLIEIDPNTGEHLFPIKLPFKQKMIIGREEDFCDIQIMDELVSRSHCSFDYNNDGAVFIVDLNSHNGTSLNENKISPQEKTLLKEGDKLKIGSKRFIFKTTLNADNLENKLSSSEKTADISSETKPENNQCEDQHQLGTTKRYTMSVKGKCPYCGIEFEASDEFKGKEIACKCGKSICVNAPEPEKIPDLTQKRKLYSRPYANNLVILIVAIIVSVGIGLFAYFVINAEKSINQKKIIGLWKNKEIKTKNNPIRVCEFLDDGSVIIYKNEKDYTDNWLAKWTFLKDGRLKICTSFLGGGQALLFYVDFEDSSMDLTNMDGKRLLFEKSEY